MIAAIQRKDVQKGAALSGSRLLIFQTSKSMENTLKGRILRTEDFDDYDNSEYEESDNFDDSEDDRDDQ